MIELLLNAVDARAADDGVYTEEKDFFIYALPAALDAKAHCGVKIDADAIRANAERINLDIENAPLRYPAGYFQAVRRHLSLKDDLLRVMPADAVCRGLINFVDTNRLWKGWRVLP